MWVKLKDVGVNSSSLTTVPGDPDAPAATWWNLWYLIAMGWKTVVVFDVGPFIDSFRVGFINSIGEVHVGPVVRGKVRFAALVGREDCRFFARDTNGKDVSLRIAKRMTRKEYKVSSHYTLAPLI